MYSTYIQPECNDWGRGMYILTCGIHRSCHDIYSPWLIFDTHHTSHKHTTRASTTYSCVIRPSLTYCTLSLMSDLDLNATINCNYSKQNCLFIVIARSFTNVEITLPTTIKLCRYVNIQMLPNNHLRMLGTYCLSILADICA